MMFQWVLHEYQAAGQAVCRRAAGEQLRQEGREGARLVHAAGVHAVALKDGRAPAARGRLGRAHHAPPLVLELVDAQLPHQPPERPRRLLLRVPAPQPHTRISRLQAALVFLPTASTQAPAELEATEVAMLYVGGVRGFRGPGIGCPGNHSCPLGEPEARCHWRRPCCGVVRV